MEATSQEKVYKSPKRKLFRFFIKSRDNWKGKCKDSKAEIKKLKNKISFLKDSKKKWKTEAKAMKIELTQLQKKMTKQSLKVERVKKNGVVPTG